MSTLLEDNEAFQKKYGFDQDKITMDKIDFRHQLLTEEFNEIKQSLEDLNPEEWVDGHIDLIVIALGNLYLAGIDVETAWKEVVRANMSKIRGIKPGRENSGGFDVMKPEGWKAPDHSENHGVLDEVFTSKSTS